MSSRFFLACLVHERIKISFDTHRPIGSQILVGESAHQPRRPFCKVRLSLQLQVIIHYREMLTLNLIYINSCGGQKFVLKHVSKSIFEHLLRLKREFVNGNHLQLPFDHNAETQALVFEQYRDDLLSFVKKNKQTFSTKAIKWILFEIGRAIKELHDKNWAHLGSQTLQHSFEVSLPFCISVTDLDTYLRREAGEHLTRLAFGRQVYSDD